MILGRCDEIWTGRLTIMEQYTIIFREIYKGFEIEHCKRQEPCNMDLYHYHSGYEVYYLLSGIRNYFIKDRIYRIERGDIVVINRNDLHKTTYAGSMSHERILINFEETFINEMMPCLKDIDILKPFHDNIHIIKLNKAEQMIIEKNLFKIMTEAKEKCVGSESFVILLMMELLIFISRMAAQPKAATKEYLNPMHAKILDIVKYININYMNELTLQHISENFYISPSYLSRLFKNVTGFTFVEYLKSIRIKEAQHLLKESKFSMDEIAERTGYESSTHFGRVFKEITGFSPLRFRKINKVF